MAENAVQQQGKIRAAVRERNVPRLGSLVIYFGLGRELRHFCFWMVPGRVFLCLCALTPWNVCWKRKLCNHCQHQARVFPAAVTDDYYRHICAKSPCSMTDFWFEQSGDTFKWLFLSAEVAQTSKVWESLVVLSLKVLKVSIIGS